MPGQVHREQVQAWFRPESPLSSFSFSYSSFFFWDGASRIIYHLLLLYLFHLKRVTMSQKELLIHQGRLDRGKATCAWQRRNYTKCHETLFSKVSWEYENIKTILASQFSLLIYNHLSHTYIQYIKIYIKKRNLLLENTYYCWVKLRHLYCFLSAGELFLKTVQKL